MMNRTTIEWVRNQDGSQGYTLNPFTGCLGPNSDGIRCAYCYAWRESLGRCRQADLSGDPIELGHYDDPFYPRFHLERLEQIVSRSKPSGIFLCDRSDLFANYWPPQWQQDVFNTIKACPWHRFYLLTHQPQELPKFSPFPQNCWVGATTTNRKEYAAALVWLTDIEARIRFISLEPLLEPISPYSLTFLNIVDLIIIGAMTGTRWDLVGKRENLADQYSALTPMPYGKIWTLQPKLEWVLEIVEAADAAKVKVFLKNNLVPMIANSPGPEKVKLYEEMGLRQEMP